MSDFSVVIPARFASTRLPGKPLREIHGEPMIRHVYERGLESGAREVIVATDDERIRAVAEGFGATACMTGKEHRSGTERIAEVADRLGWPDERIVVNLQGDEPAMPAALIGECAGLLGDASVDIGTLASPLASARDFDDPNVVKVITDRERNAIYFSRLPIPYARLAEDAARARGAAREHHGLYAYRCGVLRRLVSADAADIEICEQLEQLRALALGMTIRVGVPSVAPGRGVDTEEDLVAVSRQLS